MPAIHFDYQSRRSLRYTYHPPEEIRIEREMRRLQMEDKPFGAQKVQFLSRNTLLRVVELLTQMTGLFHPRLLKGRHFHLALPGWKARLTGLYDHFNREKPAASSSAITFMLDHLGVERLDDLTPSEQVKYLGLGEKRHIYWDQVSPQVQRALLARLAEEAGLPHLRLLTYNDLRRVSIPELGTPLQGFQHHYSRLCPAGKNLVEFILDSLEVPAFDSLPWEEQLVCLKNVDRSVGNACLLRPSWDC